MASLDQRLGAAGVLGEAGQMFRRHLLGPAWIYYLFTAPFVLAAIEFVASLSEGLVIPGEIARRAFVLSGLFCLKSAGQTIYCRSAVAELTGAPPAWSAGGIARLAVVAGTVQSIMLPVSILSSFLFVTFGVTCAMCQHLFVLAGEKTADWKPALKRAYKMSMEGVWAQHGFWSLASLLYLVIFVNLAFLFQILPALLKTLFNIDTVFSESPVSTLNSTFLMLALGFTYLAVDPIVKLGYVIFHYRSVSRKSGADLLARLSAVKAARGALALAALAVLVFVMAPSIASAGDRRILDGPEDTRAGHRDYYVPLLKKYWAEEIRRADTAQLWWIPELLQTDTWTPETVKFLKQRVRYESQQVAGDSPAGARNFSGPMSEVFRADQYRWRVAYEPEPARKDGLFAPLFEWLGRPVKAAVRWLNRGVKKIVRWLLEWILNLRDRSGPASPPTAVPYYLELAGIVFVFVLSAVLAVLLVRQRKKFVRATAPPAAGPDLEASRIDARQLALDEWMAMAESMLRENRLPLALRAVFLATLSKLNELGLIRFEPHKTNLAYVREFSLRGVSAAERAGSAPPAPQVPASPTPAGAFSEMVLRFERVWYGGRPVTLESFESFRGMTRAVLEGGAGRAA